MSKGRDTLYEQLFEKSDGTTFKKYVWTSNMEKGEYPIIDGQMVTPIFDEPKPEVGIIISKKMSKREIVADRKRRSSADFRKNILPELGVAEKIHHATKNKPSK